MSEAPAPATASTTPRFMRMFVSPWFWVLIVAFTGGVTLWRGLRTPPPPPLPVLGQLAPFELRSEQDRPFGTKNLDGKVWVANFIFTRCPTICPVFSAKMAEVQKLVGPLEPTVHLVSFSVDPAYDQPDKLLAYAERFHANPRVWTFLTGDPEAIKETVISGFKIAVGRDGPADDLASIFHGTHFVLVDGRGRLRGYYDSNEPGAPARVARDAALLVNRPD